MSLVVAGMPKQVEISSAIVPITDGVVISPDMLKGYENHYVSITFFNGDTGQEASIVPKATMTGSVVFNATINGVEWGTMWVDEDKNGTLVLGDAGELSGELSGTYKRARATLGVTGTGGATHCQLRVNSIRG